MTKASIIFLAMLPLSGWAQTPMSLKEAVHVALEKNQSIVASNAFTKSAESGIAEARAGFLPKVDYSESWTRSNNPVFVFSSLLTQHQFEEGNFMLGPLNRPDFLNNFQSRVTADQPLYDAGKTKHAIRSAELTKDIAVENSRLTQTEVITDVVKAYYAELLSAQQLSAANQAMHSAEADLARAQAIRSVGMSTDVDVLSIRVHLAGVREQQIRRAADQDVARAALNDVLGMPLDTPHTLSEPLSPMNHAAMQLSIYEKKALLNRPDARQLKLSTSLAKNQAAEARSSLLPTVAVHGAFEGARQQFYNRGGANWLGSVGLHWNLFNGLSDKARIDASQFALRRTEAEEKRADSAIQLQVRGAYADFRAARERIEVAKASVAEAEESLRITQNRYESGMSNVTDLLRTETAVFESRTRYLTAVRDERVAGVMLEMAAGTLSANSEVLQ
jgi:outer membrane protein TolC